MSLEYCPVCHGELAADIKPWHLVCKECHYEGSKLEPRIVERAASGDLDEVAREHALLALRQRNFKVIAHEISRLVPRNEGAVRPRLLDVGCAHGWFMQACEESFDVLGIEPDEAVAIAASKRVGPIRQGFFPDILSSNEKFDVIVFNDVLEHIPDIVSTLRACNKHLSAGGLLVINAPCRLGAIYRFSKLLARSGWSRSFDRMWQLGFPSPHVHYLDTQTVGQLAKAANFEMVKRSKLPSVASEGLYSRIRYSNEISRFKAVLIALAVLLSIPVLRLLPSDIEVWYLRKSGELELG